MAERVSYMSEPPTNGKVILHTSMGPLDCELWSKQCPKACRNFVQLCLEGYYDGCKFTRVIKDFMAQTGDPTNTGQGGESSFGEPFKDEFHTRLRFNRRGLLAMAGEGDVPNMNGSQFFFTLGACEWLKKKNTLFGKITGDTLFNLVNINDIDVDGEDRPINAPKINHVEVLLNPFPDIVPRIKDKESSTKKKKKKKKKGVKNLSLLSFGEEQGDAETKLKQVTELEPAKSKSSHDLLDDELLSAEAVKLKQAVEDEEADDDDDDDDNDEEQQTKDGQEEEEQQEGDEGDSTVGEVAAKTAGQVDVEKRKLATRNKLRKAGSESAQTGSLDEKMAAKLKDKMKDLKQNDPLRAMRKDQRATFKSEYNKLQSEVKALDRRSTIRKEAKAKATKGQRAFQIRATSTDELMTPLEQKRQKYLQRSKRTKGREKETMAKLNNFLSFLKGVDAKKEKRIEQKKEQETVPVPAPADTQADSLGTAIEADEEEQEVEEDLKDGTWLAHRISFKRRPQDFDAMSRNQDSYEYDIYDPRDVDKAAAAKEQMRRAKHKESDRRRGVGQRGVGERGGGDRDRGRNERGRNERDRRDRGRDERDSKRRRGEGSQRRR